MKDFIYAAFPYIVIGISIAIMSVNKKNKKDDNYIIEGMLYGMSFGLLIGTSFNNIGLFLSLGMLLGESLGYLVKK